MVCTFFLGIVSTNVIKHVNFSFGNSKNFSGYLMKILTKKKSHTWENFQPNLVLCLIKTWEKRFPKKKLVQKIAARAFCVFTIHKMEEKKNTNTYNHTVKLFMFIYCINVPGEESDFIQCEHRFQKWHCAFFAQRSP